MGIKIEFNPDLCLRVFGTLGRHTKECLPDKSEEGRYYQFKKEGRRVY